MNFITAKPPAILLITLLLCLPFLSPAMADEILTDNQTQKIFGRAVEERDSGKIFDAIEKFEYATETDEKDTHYSRPPSAWMRMLSLHGWFYGVS